MVPSVDLKESHGRINHDMCPEGDLFEHPAAKSHSEATEIYDEKLRALQQ